MDLTAIWHNAVRRARTTRLGLLTRCAVTASLVLGPSAGASSASSGWQPSTVLAPAFRDSALNVAVDAKGDALAVWTAGLESSNAYVSDQADVYSSYRPAGSDGWSKPLAIGTGIYKLSPAVAFDGAGNATVAWMSGHTVLLASTRSAATGKWAKPKQVSPPAESPVSWFSPALGVDAAGDAVLAWTTEHYPSCCVDEVSYRPAGGRWQPPTKRSGYSLGLAVASDGSMLLTYLDGDVVKAETGFRGNWDGPVVLGEQIAGGFQAPAPAIAPGGDAAVVWASNDPGFNYIAHAAVRTAGVWQPTQPISFLDGNVQFTPAPSVGIDAHGNILATFNTFDADATFRPAGAAWERPVLVGLDGTLSNVVMNAAGQAVVLGVGYHQVGDPLAAADYAPGVGWEPAQTLDAHSGADYPTSPAVAIDPAGDAIAVWEHNPSGSSAIESAILDAGGPLLHAVFNQAPPRISGNPRPGGTLRCATGTWTGDPPITFRFRWLRGFKTVGSTQTYRVTHADAGSRLTCRVTATNTLSSTTASSPPIHAHAK